VSQVRAITLRPPWGWLAATGATSIIDLAEPTAERGLIALYSSGPWDLSALRLEHVRAALDCTCSGQPWETAARDCRLHRADSVLWARITEATGGIIATAHLVDVHPDRGCCRPWGSGGFHYQLYDPQLLEEPVPAPGLQRGAWYVPPQIARLVLVAA
jgi:hypothetical protein